MLQEIKKIDLSKIKLAVFDFDFTLADHQNKGYAAYWKELDNSRTFYLEAYLHPETFYEETEVCAAPEAMRALVAYLREQGTKLICLSAMGQTLHARAKQCFIEKHYGPGFEFLSCGSHEKKQAALQILQEALDCRPEELLFVDDMADNVERANDCGFTGLRADQVAALTEL